MKSPEVVEQLKKYQSRRRSQFLQRCQAARHNARKCCCPDVSVHCTESVDRQVSAEKRVNASCSCSAAALTVTSTLSSTVEPLTGPAVTNAAVTETAHSLASEIWSKSDSAFTSFTSASNNLNAV